MTHIVGHLQYTFSINLIDPWLITVSFTCKILKYVNVDLYRSLWLDYFRKDLTTPYF